MKTYTAGNNTVFYGAQVETGVFTATSTTDYIVTQTGIGPGNRAEVAAVSQSVPEPTFIALIAVAGAGLLARRRRIL